MKRFAAFLVALIALLAPLSAHAQGGRSLTVPELNSEVNTLWPNQDQGAVTPFNARQTLLDIIASGGAIADLASPPPIGNVTPNSGAFTTLTANALDVTPAANSTAITVGGGNIINNVIDASGVTVNGAGFVMCFTGTCSNPNGSSTHYFNYMKVFADNLDLSSVGSVFDIDYYAGGSNLQGNRGGFQVNMYWTAASSASNTLRNYSALGGQIVAQQGDGGTNTSSGALGAYFAIGGQAVACGTSTNTDARCPTGATTDIVGLVTQENDVTAYAGSSMRARIAYNAVDIASAVQGAAFDVAHHVSGSGLSGTLSIGGWGCGFCSSDYNGSRAFNSNATFAGMLTAETLTNGLDFHLATFTGYAEYLPNDSIIAWENAAGNGVVQGITVDSNNNIDIGPSGFSGTVFIFGSLAPNASNSYNFGGASNWWAASYVANYYLKGSSTGYTEITSANAGATNYTVTIPAATDTVALISQAQTLTNKTIAYASNTLTGVAPTASPTFSGTVTGPDSGTWTSTGLSVTEMTLTGGSFSAGSGRCYIDANYGLSCISKSGSTADFTIFDLGGNTPIRVPHNTSNVYMAGTLSVASLSNTATTSAVCYNTSTGLFTYDSTIGTCNTSDETLKEFDGKLTNSLNKLVSLSQNAHFGYFHWNNTQYGSGEKIGAGAQTVAQYFPELVARGDDGLYSLAYDKLVVPIIDGLADEDRKIADLTARLAAAESCLRSAWCRATGL